MATQGSHAQEPKAREEYYMALATGEGLSDTD